jgi:alpha-ketoglutaric semialdehyde dehydrogenase
MITENIIGYQLSALSGKYIYATAAESLQPLPEKFSSATLDEVNQALEKAHEAWRTYRNIPGDRRAAFLKQIAKGIEDLGDQLVTRIMMETAYPEARVIVERNRTCAQLKMFAALATSGNWRTPVIDPALPDRTPAPRPELRRMMFPVGPVVVFGASNFPLAYSTAGGDVASALATGCPVIVKAHDSHLGTNALVAEVIMHAAKETGMPDGVFSSLIGDGFTTGKQLVLHHLTAAVGFTGSKAGGRALFDLGQQREIPIPVFAEMGSVNPVFLLPGKITDNPKTLAAQLAASMTMTVGQFCTNPGLLIALKNDETQQLVMELKEQLEKVSSAAMLNESILKSFHKGVRAIEEIEGVEVIHEAGINEENKTTPVLALVDANVFLSNPPLHLEVFGPFSLLVLCENPDQMQRVASALEGQLTATIQAQDIELEEVQPLVEILKEKAGRIIFNGVPTGVEVCEAMTHGGPYPASTDSRFTAVGHHAIWRWLRPLTFQNFPASLWPDS